MLRKYKLLQLVLLAGVAMAVFAVMAITAHGATSSDAGSQIVVNGSGWRIYSSSYTGYGISDYEVVSSTVQDQYYETILFSNDIYITYDLMFPDLTDFSYLSGAVICGDNFSVTGTIGNSFSIDQLSYNTSLVYSSEGISVGFNDNGNNSNTIYITFEDLYANWTSHYSWTICVHCTGRAIYGSGSFRNPILPVITVNHTMSASAFSTVLVGSEPNLMVQLTDAIDNSLAVQAIDSHTSQINDKLGYVYDRLGVSNQLLQTGNATSADIDFYVRQIYNLLATDDLDDYDAIGESVDDLNVLENNVEGSVNDIIDDINSAGFNTAVSSISSVDSGGFITTNAKSFGFWRDVGNWFLDASNMGIFTTFLVIILVLSFITWVLAL